MKTKIVLWGETEKDEKVLIGIELIEADNVVRIHTIPEAIATETIYNQMMNQWRNGQDMPMPEGSAVSDRPLTMTDSLLPDELKTDRQDILARAKTEWHFIVLSSKLYNSYADEISEFKAKVEKLATYDNAVWDDLKSFWEKVQEQVRESNIFREHATELRSRTNVVFDDLKSLRKSMNDGYEKISREHMNTFYEKLDDIEKRIESGLGLHPIFNELKTLQNNFKGIKFTRKHHNDVWNRIDKAFKLVKEKKYGNKSGGGNNNSGAVGRLESRYNGLMSAIGKMNSSIGRDKQDEAFQLKRINTTDGQLELQIRQAKMAMIQERIASKQIKLDDMLKTKEELTGRIESEKKKAEAKAAKALQQEELKKAKKEIKEEIAKEIETKSESNKENEEKLTKAAEAIKAVKAKREAAAKAKKENIAPIESTTPTAAEELTSTAGIAAVASEIVSDTPSEATEQVTSEVTDVPEVTEVPAVKVVEETTEKVETAGDKIGAAIDAGTDKAMDIAADVKEEVQEKVVMVKEALPSMAEVVEKVSEVKEDLSEAIEDIVDNIADSPVVEALSDVKDAVMSKISSLLSSEEE